MNTPTDWRERFTDLCDKIYGYIHQKRQQELVAFIAEVEKEAEQRGRDMAVEELFNIEKEKWTDAVHCTCLGYALIELAGGEDSAKGQAMQDRLLEAARTNTQS